MATKRSATTVTIACKLPQGLVITVPGTKRTIKLHGALSPFAIMNHGMTSGVSAADWEAIKTEYAEATWLKNEFVFAYAAPEDASAKAQERKDVENGFEPVNPDDTNRMRKYGLEIAND